MLLRRRDRSSHHPTHVHDHPTHLYERIGGAPALKSAVDLFYNLVLDDEDLAAKFTGVDMDNLKRHQAAMLTTVLGGPDGYEGRTMAQAHRDLAITDGEFDKVADLLHATLLILHVPADIVRHIMAAVGGLRGQIVTA